MSKCMTCGSELKWAKVPTIELGFAGGNVTERDTYDLVEYCPVCDLGNGKPENDVSSDDIPF